MIHLEIRKCWNGVDGLHTHSTSNQSSTHSSYCQSTSGASEHTRVAVGLALLRFSIERMAELRGRWGRRLAVASAVSTSIASATMMVVFVTKG